MDTQLCHHATRLLSQGGMLLSPTWDHINDLFARPERKRRPQAALATGRASSPGPLG